MILMCVLEQCFDVGLRIQADIFVILSCDHMKVVLPFENTLAAVALRVAKQLMPTERLRGAR